MSAEDAANEFLRMLKEYVGALFGESVALEATSVLPELLSNAQSWSRDEQQLGQEVNEASPAFRDTFGDRTILICVSAKNMLRMLSKTYHCDKVEIARQAAALDFQTF